MGACGCSDFNARYRFAGPEGVTYAFEINRGCDYCGTPAGVIIYRYCDATAKEWGLASLPELPVVTYTQRLGRTPTTTDIDGEFAAPVFDPQVAIRMLRERFGEARMSQDEDEYTLADALDDEGRELLDEALCESIASLWESP